MPPPIVGENEQRRSVHRTIDGNERAPLRKAFVAVKRAFRSFRRSIHMPDIRIDFRAKEPMKRSNEPVTCGVPFPKGMLFDDKTLGIFDAAGNPVPLHTRVLGKWSDRSARWGLCDWQATQSASGHFKLLATALPRAAVPPVTADANRC